MIIEIKIHRQSKRFQTTSFIVCQFSYACGSGKHSKGIVENVHFFLEPFQQTHMIHVFTIKYRPPPCIERNERFFLIFKRGKIFTHKWIRFIKKMMVFFKHIDIIIFISHTIFFSNYFTRYYIVYRFQMN